MPEDVTGELLRVVDGERPEIDPGCVRHRTREPVEEGRDTGGIRPGRDDEEERLVDQSPNGETQRPRGRLIDPLRIVDDDAHGGTEPVHGVEEKAADRDGAVGRLRILHPRRRARVQCAYQRLDGRVAEVGFERIRVDPDDRPAVESPGDVGEERGLSQAGISGHQYDSALEESAIGDAEDGAPLQVTTDDHHVISPHDGSASRSGLARRSFRVFHGRKVARQHPFGCSGRRD